MGGKAHHPSSSESDDWGDESWIVACPCGVNFDDGEEMVECDKCGVWVHTHCCRVPKGLAFFVCDKCKSKKKKQQELEEVAEVTQVLETLGHQVEAFASSEQQQQQTTTPITSAHEMLSEERAHVHGIPGGDARMFVGVSKVFSQQLWKFTGYVPKVLHIESNELAPWPYEDGFSHLLPDSSSSPQHKLENENTMEKHEDEETEKNHKDVKPLPDHTATTISHKDKHGRRGGSGGDGKRGGEGKHCKHRPKQQQHQQQQQQHQRGFNKEERSHCHGKRAGDESSHKDHSVKKRARIGGDGGKATDEEQLQQQQHSKKGGDGLISEVAGIVGSVASLKSPLTSPKNPKAMKKMAVQEFMDGGILLCSQCAKIEQVSCREAHGSGGGPELFLCQECAKLRDLPHSEPELREGPSCLASSMPITEEARAKGAAGSNSGCKDPKQIDPRETWDVSRSKKLNDEMEQLGCSTKSEFLGRNGRPGDNYKAAVVEGSHAERDNNAGGSTATTLPTAVQDDKATVCQRERESQPKEVLEVMPGGETNNSPVSEPVFLRVDMLEAHIEAASGQEVRKEGEQAASPQQLHDSTKVSPKLSTPIVGTSAPSVTSSTLASSKMFSNTGWGLGSARAISVPFSTPLHMPEAAASGQTLNAKAKADDHVQNQNSLTIASLSYKGGDVPAPGCGGEVSLPADFASSPRQQVLPGAGNPVGPLQETVLDLQMERPDTLPLQKSPVFAEATPSRETLSHTPTIDTDLVDDMSADPPSSRLSEMASCKAAEDKPFNLEHGGHGSACTLGRFPLSSEEVALGEQSVQQQRQQQGSGPLNQQHLPAYPERLGLPVGSDESEPARTTSGADETTLSEMQKNLQPQVMKFMMSGHPSSLSSLSNNNNNKNPPPLSSKPLPSTFGHQQEPEKQLHSVSQSSAPVGQSSNLEPTTSSVSHTHFPEQPGQSGQRTQNAVVDLNPSSPSLPPVCQQARQSSGHHVHVVSLSQQPTNSSISEPHSASTGGGKPPGPGSGLVPKPGGTSGPKFPSSGALSSSPSSPPSSKPQQTVSSSSPCSPPSQWTTPGVSSRPPHPVLSGRPSSGGTTSSTTALNSKLPSGTLHSHKSGPLSSASSVPIKLPNISKVPTRAISLPSKLNEVSTSLTKPSKAVGVRTSSQGPLPSGLAVKENSKHPASVVLKAPTSAKPSLQSSSVKHMTSISKSSHSHSSKTLSSQTSSTKQVPSLMSTPSKSTSVGQVSKNTATTPLKPGLVSTSHKEEKCGLNAAPLPSKSTLTMPPPPPPTAVKRVTPAITTSQATSVTTMNDEELALKLHQELNSSPRVPRLPRVRQTNTTHQLTSSSQSLTVTPAKRSASAMTTPAGSSQKDHHLLQVPRKRLREDRSKDNFRSSSGNMDEGGKVSGVSPPVSFSRRQEDSGRTEEAAFLKVKSRSGSPDSESSKEKAVAIPFSAHSSGEGVARHSSFPRGKLSIIVPQGTDDSSDSAELKSPADGGHLSGPGVIDEGTRGPISSVATVEAAPPHVQRLRKVSGEPYLHSGHRQVSVDTLQKRTLSSHHPDHRTSKVQPPSSRRRRWTGPSGLTESEEDDETEGGVSPPHHHDGIEKGKFEKHRRDYYGGDATDEDDDPPRHKDSVATREDVPKGKRKARRRRLLAVDEGHDGIRGKRKVSKTVRKSEVHEKVASTAGQEEEPDAPSSPSSEEVVSNYSEEDEEMVVRRGIRSRHRRGEGDSSGGEDYEGD